MISLQHENLFFYKSSILLLCFFTIIDMIKQYNNENSQKLNKLNYHICNLLQNNHVILGRLHKTLQIKIIRHHDS